MNRLVTLGVKGGPSLRPGGAMPSSSLLELDGQSIVIDAGLDVSRALVNAGFALNRLATIFITHLHSDHVLELGPLNQTAWTCGLKSPVRVYGPPGIAAYWDGFIQSMAYDIHLRQVDDGRPPLADLVTVIPLAEGRVPFDMLRVHALAVNHPPVNYAYAYRFDGSKSVTFSGDAAYHPPLAYFAKGTDWTSQAAVHYSGPIIVGQDGLEIPL